MKKIILICSIVMILLCSIFVSAYMEQIQGDEDKITYTASVREGWNLLNAGIYSANMLTSNSDINENDITAVFVYSPSTNQFIRIKPNLEEGKYNAEKSYYNGWTSKIHSLSAWVYVERDGMIEYTTDDIISMTHRELTSGWNFVSVTENALGKSLNDLKGSCNIQKAYYYLEGYKNLDLNMELPTDMSSQGLLIKVSSDCSFEKSGSSITPPSMPGNNLDTREQIEHYYYEEFSYEDCELNNAKDYNSVSDCSATWRCLSQEYAKLIPESDLQNLADYMKEYGGESGSIWYDDKNPSVKQQLTNKFDLCLSGRHKDY